MKEKRVTKKAIFASLLSMAVCTSMLIGTSYAWFTDSVSSNNNVIQSGTLKIGFQVKDGDNWKDVDGAIFGDDILWEPGYTAYKQVRVYNDGSLALKYTMKFDGENLADSELADVIDVYYAPAAVDFDERPTAEQLAPYYKGTLADVFDGTVDAIDGHLAANEGETVYQNATVLLKMKEEAGNTYQNKSIGAFSLTVVATQDTVEEDAFNDQYDAQAEYPVISQTGLNKALEDASDGDVIPVSAGNYTLPQAVPAGVTLSGEEGTNIDTTNISGDNRGTLDNVTANGINFTSSNDDTWDGIISHNTTLTDSTFDGCTFDAQADGRDNAIYGGTANGNVVFENTTIKADVYGVNFSYVNGTLTFRNCDITGWNSFGANKTAGGESKVVFENCTFHNSGYYGTLRFYQNAEIKNCMFDDNFDWVDVNANDVTVTLTGCTGLPNSKIFNNGTKVGTWIVDGTDISDSVTAH